MITWCEIKQLIEDAGVDDDHFIHWIHIPEGYRDSLIIEIDNNFQYVEITSLD